MFVDHVNHDTLDNRRSNLRLCTRIENGRNRRANVGPQSSEYKGVQWVKADRRWKAQICVDKRPITVGSFGSEIEAAVAYNAAATRYFGEFALLNILPTGEADGAPTGS
jgi:hypothetical protein